jgi:hypothetical protein
MGMQEDGQCGRYQECDYDQQLLSWLVVRHMNVDNAGKAFWLSELRIMAIIRRNKNLLILCSGAQNTDEFTLKTPKIYVSIENARKIEHEINWNRSTGTKRI